jgi:nicotinamidase-related amidase
LRHAHTLFDRRALDTSHRADSNERRADRTGIAIPEVNVTERVWDKFLTERDKTVFGAAGYAQPQGFGKRPAVLVIDVNYHFCGDRPEPILESIKRWPNSCGEDAWTAIPHIQALLRAARGKGLPVIYTTGGFREDGWDYGSWLWKTSRLREDTPKRNLNGEAIVADIAPRPDEIVIPKLKPSAFHGTPLRGYVNLLQADSMIVCGTTTSGCVRASVIDAFSDNLRVTIAEEGCFDRSQASHAVNLMDMNAKYADVRPMADIVAEIDKLPDGLFELPGKGRAPRA